MAGPNIEGIVKWRDFKWQGTNRMDIHSSASDIFVHTQHTWYIYTYDYDDVPGILRQKLIALSIVHHHSCMNA